MKQYKEMLRHVLENGEDKKDRTGVGTRSVFGYEMRFNLNDGFPLVTTKFTSIKTIFLELVWYLRGNGNIKFLKENGVKIWDEWADENGDLGPVYPEQWRNWKQYKVSESGAVTINRIDQIKILIDGLKNNPSSRRHIVSAWNVAEISDMKLPPCHSFFQFYVSGSGKLSCKLTQRSNDLYLGNPFNVACYSLLTHILAKICGYKVGDFIISIGDAHIYHNHFNQVKEILTREPYPLPTIIVPESLTDIDQLTSGEISWDDFKLLDYKHHPKLSAPVAV